MSLPPLFSVLMPTYNEGWYIRDAIESILTQTFTDFELIIVNDGSTDDTPAHIAAYQDDRITVITFPENRGRPHARNAALDAARGKYIVWMDSDDIAVPNRLALHYDVMEKIPDLAVCSGSMLLFSRESGISSPPRDYNAICAGLFMGATIFNGASCLRREAIIATGTRYDEKLARAQDYDFWCALLLDHKLKAANISEVLLLYRLQKVEPYKAMHDEVLKKNLQRLGMSEESTTLNIYKYLSHDDGAISPPPLQDIVAWIKEVLHCNNKNNVFPQRFLSNILYFRAWSVAVKISPSKEKAFLSLVRLLPITISMQIFGGILAKKSKKIFKNICLI